MWPGHAEPMPRHKKGYVPNYLGWRRMLEPYQQGIRSVHCIREAVGHTLQQAIGT
ncbi:hypothetical protein C4K38_3625 [Pseudomonas chlororaphis subsp. piscium]|nr:hypothetical protein C4K38_3625 [Pseudomonas chlororaphis subsp. piscium]AZC51171.1 hypothetical protein C4K35_3590 [Pseudomonas chlororaphis subsp. piscium]